LKQNLVAAEAGALNIANLVNAGLPYAWPTPPALVYWSLSLEEQFYLALPLLTLLCGRSLPWLLAGALVYQFTMPLTVLADFTRPGALAVGVLLAIAARQQWYASLRPTLLGRSAAARAVFTLLCIAALGRLGTLSTPAKLTLVALIAGAMVFAASFDGFQIWPDHRTARLLAWLGSRSYAIYRSPPPNRPIVWWNRPAADLARNGRKTPRPGLA
jgi:peptidoglycan/LPS O-acetylase OafA/YrhL